MLLCSCCCELEQHTFFRFRFLANVSPWKSAPVRFPGVAKLLANPTVSHGQTFVFATVILPFVITELLVVTKSTWSSISPDPGPPFHSSEKTSSRPLFIISIPNPPPVYPIQLSVRNPREQKFPLFLGPYWCKMGLSITSDEYDLLREVNGFLWVWTMNNK